MNAVSVGKGQDFGWRSHLVSLWSLSNTNRSGLSRTVKRGETLFDDRLAFFNFSNLVSYADICL